MNKWDRRFLDLARLVAGWSKDRTQVGAVIVDPQRRIVSVGYNGMAQGVKDNPERYENRDVKLRMIIHAEMNCITFAGHSLAGCTLYTWPFMPCARCAALIVQHGIKRVVAPQASAELQQRWAEDLALTQEMFEEAGVSLEIVEWKE